MDRRGLENLRSKRPLEQSKLSQMLAALPEGFKTLWYPNAGMDFRDLMVFAAEQFVYASPFEIRSRSKFEFLPHLHIHNDLFLPELQNGIIFDDSYYRMRLIDQALVEWNKYFEGVLYYMELESEMIGRQRKLVLCLKGDTLDVLRDVFLNHDHGIDFLVTIRDGANASESSSYGLRMLEFFISHLGVRYFATDNTGRGIDGMERLLEDPVLGTKLKQQVAPYLLRGMEEFRWSEYGTFKGDAHLYEVQKADIPHPHT